MTRTRRWQVAAASAATVVILAAAWGWYVSSSPVPDEVRAWVHEHHTFEQLPTDRWERQHEQRDDYSRWARSVDILGSANLRMAREDVYWVAGDHEQTLDEVLAFVAGQAETDHQLVWRSHQPLAALVGDVPDDDELWILRHDPTDVIGLSYEQRNELWQALPALERVIDLRADNAPQVAWDDDAVLRWAAFTQDHEPLSVKIILERAPGGVRATIETFYYGGSF
jgi:hypothetical protein